MIVVLYCKSTVKLWSLWTSTKIHHFFPIQLSHGEPSWVPGSGVQSPVMSEVDLSALAGQHDDDEPPILTPQPDSIEELQPSSPVPLHPGLEAESRPGDLSGESDGVPSLPDGGEDGDQSGKTVIFISILNTICCLLCNRSQPRTFRAAATALSYGLLNHLWGPEKFSHPESQRKLSNLTITELFNSVIFLA